MQHVLTIHAVAAFPTWKAILDQAAGRRHDSGFIYLKEIENGTR